VNGDPVTVGGDDVEAGDRRCGHAGTVGRGAGRAEPLRVEDVPAPPVQTLHRPAELGL
jgi:hypothetical protein